VPEDKPGGELLDMHAEKDMNISIENDKNVFIDGNRTTIIKKKQQDNVVGSVTLSYKYTWNATVPFAGRVKTILASPYWR